MDLESTIAHHLFDSAPYLKLFKLGGIEFNITKHLVIMWFVGGFMLALFSFAARGTSRTAVLLRAALEGVALYLRDEIIEPILGHDAGKYLHYFLTLFFFILFCNLAGLIPGSATATGNISVTGGLAFCSFGLVMVAGYRAQGGLLKFLGHFIPLGHDAALPLKLALGPLLFVLEFGGIMVKCAVLMLRLFANMIAGHIVILGIMSLIFIFGAVSQWMGIGAGVFSVALVTFVSCLELLICLLQAFVFTLLTAVFVGSVVHAH
jgi:F-type H+-transporting ATPase subunit a